MFTALVSLVLAAAPASSLRLIATDEPVTLKIVSSDAMRRLGYYSPLRLDLSPTRPESLTTLPDGFAPNYFSVIRIAAEGTPIFHVALEELDGSPPRLFVDTNGDGDLTNDPPAVWNSKDVTAKDKKQYKQYDGNATLNLGTSEAPMFVTLGFYRFDKNDPSRAQSKDRLLYFRDYATEGQMKLGDKTYAVMLNDNLAGGDFRGKPIPDMPTDKDSSGVQIAIDVNANGKFDKRGEAFDVRRPFNIGGVTYEIRDMARNGLSFTVARSAKHVDEIPLAPDHTVGKKITPFTAKDTDGKDVSFPADYKGKIVMIDFWATWCRPCMDEVPGLVAAHEKYRDKGFEVLGVSLDSAGDRAKLITVTGDKRMTWRQVFDGKGWQAAIAKLYTVESIPAMWLVDGDTGQILATAGSLRGAKLDATIAEAIKRKFSQ